MDVIFTMRSRTRYGVLFLVMLVGCPVRSYKASAIVAVDVCMSETFTAECWENEVVIMETALYGRMKVGTCVQNDRGVLGCSADVLSDVDRWCSGRQKCEVLIPGDLDRRNPCDTELRTYLHASFRCVKVAFGTQKYCSTQSRVPLLGNSGHLSSEVAERTGCGSIQTPWIIKALTGQTIRLTLHNFGYGDLMGEYGYQHESNLIYGYIFERATGTNKTVLANSQRITDLYASQSNVVEVAMVPNNGRHQSARHFVIHYQTIGCADLNPPAHAWYKREGDVAVIGCHSVRRDKTWHLRCIDNTWNGVVGNCSAPDESSAASQMDSLPFSTEVSIAIIIGIAVVFAALVLVIGILYLRGLRRKKALYEKRKKEAMKHTSRSHRPYRDQQDPKPQSPPPKNINQQSNLTTMQTHSGSASDITSIGTGNAYTHIWERPLPDPHGNQVMSDSDYASQSNYSGTTRQSKNTTGYDIEEGGDGTKDSGGQLDGYGSTGSGTRYFILDKD